MSDDPVSPDIFTVTVLPGEKATTTESTGKGAIAIQRKGQAITGKWTYEQLLKFRREGYLIASDKYQVESGGQWLSFAELSDEPLVRPVFKKTMYRKVRTVFLCAVSVLLVIGLFIYFEFGIPATLRPYIPHGLRPYVALAVATYLAVVTGHHLVLGGLKFFVRYDGSVHPLAWGVGCVERFIYSLSVFIGLPFAAIGGWLILKGLAQFRPKGKDDHNTDEFLTHYYAYMIGTGLSLIVGVVSGIVGHALLGQGWTVQFAKP